MPDTSRAATRTGRKELCLIHANCQGEPLAELLSACPEFSARYEIRNYTNFKLEKISAEELAACRVFIFQWLGSPRYAADFEDLLKSANPSAKRLPIPSMLFTGYWPFWTPNSPQDFGDSFLDMLIDKGLEKKEIMYLYLRGNLEKKFDLQAMLEESADYERVREARCIVNTVDYIMEHFREEQLFNTIAHPQKRTLALVANAVLSALELQSVPETILKEFPEPYADDLELPIHPRVGAFHGLSFAGPERLYSVYGRPMTFEQYVNRYVDCRLLKLDNFIGYLQLV